MKIKCFILVCFTSISFNTLADNNFKCVVKDAVTLESDGTLDSLSDVAKFKLGKEFVVNRQTGQMTGGGFNNTMSGFKPVVYDYLPSENSYKSITIYEPNYTVDYLEIRVYAKSKRKPFFFKSAWGSVVSGYCNELISEAIENSKIARPAI